MKARVDVVLHLNDNSYPVTLTVERTARNEIHFGLSDVDYDELPEIAIYMADVDAAALAGGVAAILGSTR